MKENKAALDARSSPAAAPTRKRSSRKTPSGQRVLPQPGLHRGAPRRSPKLKYLEDVKDGKTRYVQLRIPVTEGDRYRVGNFDFDGNKVVKTEGLRPLFKLKEGDFYSEKNDPEGHCESARELYGTGGYWEFTGFPDLKPREHRPTRRPEANDPAADRRRRTQPADRRRHDAACRRASSTSSTGSRSVGNTTTRDNVIRREMRLLENGVFNTEALKHQRQAASISSATSSRSKRQRRHQGREDAGREEQGRRHAEVRGAEPQSADVRRRRLAVRGLLRPAGVPDVELPRPRRERHVFGAGRLARAELPAGVQRAVPVRSADHRRHRPLQARDPLLLLVHAGIDRRQRRRRVPGRRLHADVPRLQAARSRA